MWKQIDAYHLRNGSWTISKMNLSNGAKYCLWNGTTNCGFFDSADEAKLKYESLTDNKL